MEFLSGFISGCAFIPCVGAAAVALHFILQIKGADEPKTGSTSSPKPVSHQPPQKDTRP